jgi:predicted DNA-binding antitoxin AbrB/MazE fold protein
LVNRAKKNLEGEKVDIKIINAKSWRAKIDSSDHSLENSRKF